MDKKPDKVIGPEGKQAKMFITKYEGGRQASKIIIDAGFNWTESIKPHLPGCPDWCPATHFGYLESGVMKVQFGQASKTQRISAHHRSEFCKSLNS